jgi:hypothetical protein
VGDKFLGIGLKKALALWLFFILMTVMAKAVLTRYPVSGLSEIVQAA